MKKLSILLAALIIAIIFVSGLMIGIEALTVKRISDKEYLPIINKLLSTGENISRIIYNNNMPYIGKRVDGGRILSQYYLESKGDIPRNSEMHKVIKRWIDSADAADKIKILYPHKIHESPKIIIPINYDSLCIVGKRYVLYPYNYGTKNPYELADAARVTIVDKKNGYVKYCYTNELKTRHHAFFSRSCKEFIDQTKKPNK